MSEQLKNYLQKVDRNSKTDDAPLSVKSKVLSGHTFFLMMKELEHDLY
jgi:hypothetical protein